MAFKFRFSAVVLSALCAVSTAASAGQWPTERPIKWYIGLPPSGGADLVTRAVADQLSKELGTPVVVENKPGADQAIAARLVSSSKPDGYTIMTMAGPNVHNHSTPDINTGLAPVALLSHGPIILAGSSSNAPKDLKSLIAAIKAHPEKWNYATAGFGSLHHIAGALINSQAGIKMNMIPYHGGGQSVQAAVSDQVPLVVIGIGPTVPYIKAGQLIGYAVASRERFAEVPKVPTFAEEGVPGVDISQYFGVAAPAGIPSDILTRLNEAINKVLKTPAVEKIVLKEGAVVTPMSPKQFGDEYGKARKQIDELAKQMGLVKSH